MSCSAARLMQSGIGQVVGNDFAKFLFTDMKAVHPIADDRDEIFEEFQSVIPLNIGLFEPIIRGTVALWLLYSELLLFGRYLHQEA